MKQLRGKFDELIVIVTMAVMLTITFVNVIARYVFHASISFTEEITTALFVLLCTLGTGIAAKRNAHLGISLITDRLSKRHQAWVAFFANLLAAAFSIILVYTGIFMVINQYKLKQLSMTLQLPEWLYGTFIPIGGSYMLYQFMRAAYRSVRIKEDK